METYQYKAFISYRHTHPDMEIARKLHGLIENFHIPGPIRKLTGVSKMGRVFRDQEELPLAVDLGEDIEKALKHSEWLIVVCSPRLLESSWCMKEIDTFIRLGKRDHILTILVEGEPDDSFPPQLRYIERSGKREEIEPLAADVRGKTLAESLRKLRGEKLRLLAPMLGLNFDDLRQRAKARQQKIRLGIVSGALAMTTAFSAYAMVQNQRIEKERDIAWNNEMQLLMEKSNVAVSNNSKIAAKGYLNQALALRERVGTQNDAAMEEAMEYAVYTGLFEPVAVLDAENRHFSSLVFSQDDSMLLGITDLNSAALVDAKTGNIRYTVSRAMTGQISEVGFLDQDSYFYVLDSWYGFVSVYRTEDGAPVAEYSAEADTAWAIAEKAFPLGDGCLLIVHQDKLLCWNYLTGEETWLLDESRNGATLTQPLKVTAFHDGDQIAVGSSGWGDPCLLYSRSTGQTLPLESDPMRGYYELTLSNDDTYLAAKSGTQVWVFRTDTGKCVLTREAQGAPDASRFALTHDGTRLVLTDSVGTRCFSVPDGEVVWERSDLTELNGLVLSPDDRFLCFSASESGVMDMKTGAVISGVSGSLFSHDGSLLLLNDYRDLPQLAVTDQTATVRRVDDFTGELFKGQRDAELEGDISLVLMHPSSANGDPTRQPRVLADPAQKYLVYAHGDGFVEIFSPESGQETAVAAYGEHCYFAVTDLVFHGELLLSTGGYGGSAVLYDCARGEIRHVFRSSGYVYGAEFSPDGTKLMLLSSSLSGGGDTASVYAAESGRLLFSMESGDAGTKDFGFTPDGTEAVLLLQDGSAVVGTLFDSLDAMIDGLQ